MPHRQGHEKYTTKKRRDEIDMIHAVAFRRITRSIRIKTIFMRFWINQTKDTSTCHRHQNIDVEIYLCKHGSEAYAGDSLFKEIFLGKIC